MSTDERRGKAGERSTFDLDKERRVLQGLDAFLRNQMSAGLVFTASVRRGVLGAMRVSTITCN